MTPTTVTPPAAAPPAQQAPPPPPQQTPPVDTAALLQRIADLEATTEEQRRNAEFWHGKATERPAAAPPAPAGDAEPEVDVLELATKGGKAFERYLEGWAKKNGFVKGEEMTAAIGHKAAEIAKQSELVQKYPELKNNNSEFFKSTALEYGNLMKVQGMTEALAMEMASERVELRFLREGKTKTPAQIQADKDAQKEQARRDRAAAGAGDRGGRRAEVPDEEDTEMTDAQKQIAIRMLVDDDTTPEQAIEKYKARATKGVAMRLK